jgi:hypothetical protein
MTQKWSVPGSPFKRSTLKKPRRSSLTETKKSRFEASNTTQWRKLASA